MEIVSVNDFMARTLSGRPSKMDVAPYNGYPFDCACGASHTFDSGSIKVIRELSGMRLVISCPQGSGSVTCVKVKGMFSFKGFESLFGAKSQQKN